MPQQAPFFLFIYTFWQIFLLTGKSKLPATGKPLAGKAFSGLAPILFTCWQPQTPLYENKY
jgi:hypothetical protein